MVLEQKGEISTVYSHKGILVCAYYLWKSASAHTLKKCRDHFGKCAYIISAMYLDLKSNKRNVLLCCRNVLIKKGYFCLLVYILKKNYNRITIRDVYCLKPDLSHGHFHVGSCMNLERGIIPHPGIKEILICLCVEYSATYNFKIAMMYND